MSLYYSDASVTLYHGDSLEILPTLDIKADVLLTDPPYFKVKQEEWDNQWDKASEFLGWMGDFLDLAKPLLTPQASVWVFASPAMTSSVERLVGERFRVLNSIRWAKTGSTHQRRSIPAMRAFASIWEGIVFAEQFDDVYGDASRRLHAEVFAPLGDYFRNERERAGCDAGALEVAVGASLAKDPNKGSGLYRRWEEGSQLPSANKYHLLRNHLGEAFFERTHESLQSEYAALKVQFEARRAAVEHLRRPFFASDRALSEDIWFFDSVTAAPGKHPCEKPEPLLRHMIEISSRPGALILDPFAGSGSTLDAARQTGRKAVGIEKDERWCEFIAKRLSQDLLELEWTA